ncbi:hypothetical protein CKO25_07520 [Thiocapsa imhoffii]|uniref:cyclic-guanylate-specific phosphodiesterase n=1 Tax=Thiocapsa imhoffii TaxID=382777 RepID=A0A9X0WH49_9GAMM|nr:GGDEF and EAL domain-containing protein [Thiocapsa imhoffii]MBK1644505.1 hypothetical protein [Thiocapsa imhoffii]
MSANRHNLDDEANAREVITALQDEIRALDARLRGLHEAEAQLLATQSLLRTVIDEIPDFVILKDHEGRFLLANRPLASFYGTTPDQMVGKDDADFSASPEQAEFFRQNVKAIMARGVTEIVFEESTDDETGEVRYFKSIKKPFVGPDGDPRILVIAHDITDIRQAQARVEASEKLLGYVHEATREGIWDWDIPSGRLQHNARWFDILGFAPEQLTGTIADFKNRLHPDDLAGTMAALESALAGGADYRHEHRMICQDGRVIWTLDRGRIVEWDSQGQPIRMVGSFADITARKLAEQQLAESEERFRRLFEDTRQPLSLIDEGRFVATNQATLQMLRMTSPDQLIGRTPGDVSPPYQRDGRPSGEKALEMIQTALDLGSYEFEWEHVRANGECFPATILLTAIREHNREMMHVVWHDMTDAKKAQARIEYMAYYDALTGLPNRVLGQKLLSHAITAAHQRAASVAVLYLDLDKFKYINDTHGHELGDQLLKAVAIRLRSQLLGEEQVCRLSGDEFMLIFPSTPRPDVHNAMLRHCKQLLTSLESPFDLDGIRLSMSFSAGCAIYPQDGMDGDTLMRNAHTALYYAKKTGPRFYRLFEPPMNADLIRFVETREALRVALERNEFELHYQPQIDLSTRRVIGVEALIRWRRPGVGLVMPGDFIEVAEESGLILPIGRWALYEACQQGAVWGQRGWSNLSIGVNLSAVQFREGQLGEDVLKALDASGLHPARLDLELTESTLLCHQETISSTLTSWKALGIRLSIDDFGTGYASLAYLKRFKADTIKIDRSFVQHLLTDQEDRAIVKAIIQVAQSLNVCTIAEGVESFELAEQLASMGCDQVQGFVYSKPLPPDAFEKWLLAAEVLP